MNMMFYIPEIKRFYREHWLRNPSKQDKAAVGEDEAHCLD